MQKPQTSIIGKQTAMKQQMFFKNTRHKSWKKTGNWSQRKKMFVTYKVDGENVGKGEEKM